MCTSDLYTIDDHPTSKKCTSDLQEVYIRPKKRVHPTYKVYTSDLQLVINSRPTKRVQATYKSVHLTNKKCIWATKSIHLTYKNCTIDLELVTIQTYKSLHSTYISIHPTYKNCTSNLQKVYIRPAKSLHPTYKVYIRPTKSLHPTYEICTSDLQKELAYPAFKILAPCSWLELYHAWRLDF